MSGVCEDLKALITRKKRSQMNMIGKIENSSRQSRGRENTPALVEQKYKQNFGYYGSSMYYLDELSSKATRNLISVKLGFTVLSSLEDLATRHKRTLKTNYTCVCTLAKVSFS